MFNYFFIFRADTIQPTDEKRDDKDFKFSYQKALLTINLLLHNINDAIREGDGERLINSYKFA